MALSGLHTCIKDANVAKLSLLNNRRVTHVEYGSAPPNCSPNPDPTLPLTVALTLTLLYAYP